jgi:hypothetical protein
MTESLKGISLAKPAGPVRLGRVWLFHSEAAGFFDK